jgi:uncharacterized membrane protein YgdD (TMEM256/DUF423 family)
MRFFALGAVNALIAVAAGAFGAHALKARLDADRLAVWETAARYHAYHALGLLAVAWLVERSAAAADRAGALKLATMSGFAMTVGIVIFCGSLYALALTGVRGLGAITPIGGLAFMVAWALAALAAWR